MIKKNNNNLTEEALADFLAEYNIKLENGEHGTSHKGNKYITFCSSGQKEEGERMPYFFNTKDGALNGILDALTKYINKGPKAGGVFYLRKSEYQETKIEDFLWFEDFNICNYYVRGVLIND